MTSLDTVLAALCQLARKPGENSAPVDYGRRRRLRSLSQAQLDIADWRRRRYFLTRPDTWIGRRELARTELPACTQQEQFARYYLIEMLTGTHPYYLPGPMRLPERYGLDYAEFVFTLPEPMTSCLHRKAHYLLRHKRIREPVSWEPPFDWVTGITWPGPHPDDISLGDLHPLIHEGLPARVIAARLATTTEHVRLAATRHRPPGCRRRPTKR
jgi:hypothetical protein